MGDVRKRAGVASRESKGQTKSIDDQDRENLAVCEEFGWDVVDLYRDGVSASRFGARVRKNWNRLVADVAAGKLDIVVVWEVSRADRDLESWVPFVGMCRRMEVRVHVTSHETTYDPTNRRQWRALIDEGVDAADESEKISARALKGIRGAVVLGKQHGRAPYGYDRRYDPEDRRSFTQVLNADARVVREIIERVAQEDPISAIERDLNGRGVVAPGGGSWTRNAIRQTARRPSYAGLRGHHGSIHPGNWPEIVDADTWHAAQAVLNDESRKTTQPGSYKWLLSYLAKSHCGGHLQAMSGRQGRRDNYKCHRDGCVGIGVFELDEYVTRLVVAWFARKGARALFERAGEDAAAGRVELRRLSDELEEWRTSADQPGGISAVALARKERALEPLIAAAQKRIVRSTTPMAALKLLTAAEAGKSLIRPCWDGLSIAARRSVITALTEAITVGPADERLSRWSPDEDRLRLATERTTITWMTQAIPARGSV